MKHLLAAAVVLAVVCIAGLAVYAAEPEKAPQQGQQQPVLYQCAMHPGMVATWEANCPKCGMKMTRMQGAPMMPMAGPMGTVGSQGPMAGPMGMGAAGGQEPMAGMMQSMDQMQGMMARCRMMMQAQLENNDPTALLAMREQLGLTDEQVAKIQAVSQDARQKAEAVLTDKQKEMVKGMPNMPSSMMDMHQRMRGMMGGPGGMMQGRGMMGGPGGMGRGMQQPGARTGPQTEPQGETK